MPGVIHKYLLVSSVITLLVSSSRPAIAQAVESDLPSTPQWSSPTEFLAAEGTGEVLGWPSVTAEARPGAYWWWPGGAVTKEDITWNLETYRNAGWGNMGVIHIYGVRGEEERFLNFFSPEWFAMFNHAVAEGKRLGMNIDLTPGSGWRLGGPHVTSKQAEQSYAVEAGKIVAKTRRDAVKRAGPGGAGLDVNPYSKSAVAFHLDWVSSRFEEGTGAAPRAFYYDSFENPGNWCSEFLDAFQELRGYDLENHAEALDGNGDAEISRRVVSDYRETLSDILINRIEEIVQWGQQRGSGLRIQAHGAPANLLDMYATGTIPETEVFGASIVDIPGYRRDPALIRPDRQSDLVNRMASSAAHVGGHNVVISESFTWLRNHYHTALSHIKAESDKLLLNGINCIYYHGSCFAPEKAAWPGWLFYASTEANARNSIFRDVPALNAYITRCQSVLQEGKPNNDVLLYWPVYDLWMSGGKRERRFSVHHPDWIDGTACGEAGRWLMENGYTFDFVSDNQLRDLTCHGGHLLTPDDVEYRVVLVPAASVMPRTTARRLLELARSGATVLVWRMLPNDVPGWKDFAARRQELRELLEVLEVDASGVARLGDGKVVVSEDLAALLQVGSVAREPMVDTGLQFVRRKSASRVSYFIVNHTAESVEGWVPLAARFPFALLMDPMTAKIGVPPIRTKEGALQIYLQMEPGETRILRAMQDPHGTCSEWPVTVSQEPALAVDGPWRVRFVEGGPELPPEVVIDELQCWTQSGAEGADRFAGAARYTTTVNVPDPGDHRWRLGLGDVRESARVWVNGKPAGVVVAHPFHLDVTDLLRKGPNDIAIEVTNLSANRIRDLDRRGVPWKKFYDINFVGHDYKPFDASKWKTKPSGLLGPVMLTPLRATHR